MSRGRKLVAGNWKMNGLASFGAALARDVCAGLPDAAVDVVLCPPATLLSGIAAVVAGRAIEIGGQDCHAAPSGAHTGDLSAEMLADAGARYVIVGHSERRADHAERDAMVRAKAEAAQRAGITAIVCVGETEAERDAGRALAVVAAQLAGSLPPDLPADRLVVAYEPVWAIGTGRTPTEGDILAMHRSLRAQLASRGDAYAAVRILYGGSVKPGNAGAILRLADVDGALVGGASLVAADFVAICTAAAALAESGISR